MILEPPDFLGDSTAGLSRGFELSQSSPSRGTAGTGGVRTLIQPAATCCLTGTTSLVVWTVLLRALAELLLRVILNKVLCRLSHWGAYYIAEEAVSPEIKPRNRLRQCATCRWVCHRQTCTPSGAFMSWRRRTKTWKQLLYRCKQLDVGFHPGPSRSQDESYVIAIDEKLGAMRARLPPGIDLIVERQGG